MAVLGLPAWRFLTTDDREERLLLLAVAEKSLRLHNVMMQNLAVRIGTVIAKAMR